MSATTDAQLQLSRLTATQHRYCHHHAQYVSTSQLPSGETAQCVIKGCLNRVHAGLKVCIECAALLGRCQVCNAGRRY